MEDSGSQPIKEAAASAPVIVTGFNEAPRVGEKFSVFESLEQAQARVDRKAAKRKEEKEVFVF